LRIFVENFISMEKVNKVIWGIVGAGDVCEVKSAPAFQLISNSEVKNVMRRNAIKAEDFAKRHGISNWTTNLDDLLNDLEINAIYIATPHDSHAEITIKAAQAGKAVYVEKPMANSYAECLQMIQACEAANVPLFVAYYRRTLNGFLKIKEIVDNKLIGDVRFVSIEMNQPLNTTIVAKPEQNWRVMPEISGGGYFHDLASHQLDFLDFLFGPITVAKGLNYNQASNYRADDIVSAVFRFPNNIIGTGTWCFSTHSVSEKDQIKIVGSKGEVEFNTFGNPMKIVLKTENGMNEFLYNHDQPIQKQLIELVVKELVGVGKSPSTGVSGARTTLIMDNIINK